MNLKEIERKYNKYYFKYVYDEIILDFTDSRLYVYGYRDSYSDYEQDIIELLFYIYIVDMEEEEIINEIEERIRYL